MTIHTDAQATQASLTYAEDLHVLWSQYKRQKDDYKEAAIATLKNIVSHCDFAISHGGSPDYFGFHATRAKQLLDA